MDSNVYVDGLNLYYGSLRNSPYKWLDIARLCQILYPTIQIKRIRYFTARVKGKLDPDAPRRQSVYLRALKTIPNLSIHEGHFTDWPIRIPRWPLKYTINTLGVRKYKMCMVYKIGEKGSDVNLATYLLDDCFDKDFDEAVVVSNDSDLELPVELVVTKYNKKVHVVNPQPRNSLSNNLYKVASSHLPEINRTVLAAAQFPSILTDAKGVFSKPSTW